MPTPISHAAIPLVIGLSLGRRTVPSRLLWLGTVFAVLPDADVLAFRFGIPYASDFGHRGLSHSLAIALAAACLAAVAAPRLRSPAAIAGLFAFVAAASHGLADLFTDGGLGIELLWPFSSDRYFAPVRPIHVAPLSAARLFSPAGVRVLMSEFVWVWMPSCAVGALVFAVRSLVERAARPERGSR